MLWTARGVFRIEVIGFRLRDDLDDGQGFGVVFRTQHHHRELCASDVLLDERSGVERQGIVDGLAHRFGALNDVDAQRGTLGRGFHHAFLAQLLHDPFRIERFTAAHVGRCRRLDAMGAVERLRFLFVYAERAAEHAWTGVRKPDHLQEALDGAVFTTFAVERQECDIKIILDQAHQVLFFSWIEPFHLVARLLKSGQRTIFRR